MSAPLEHDQTAVDAITAELVACTLGTRRRPELRVDLAGFAHRFTAAYAVYARAAASLSTALDHIATYRTEDL